MYDKKIAVIILNILEDWQKLNVTSFLASSVCHSFSRNSWSSAGKCIRDFLPALYKTSYTCLCCPVGCTAATCS